MKVLEGKKILVISPEPWTHNFVSKHHYAIQLAIRGNKVFFLNPPSASDAVNKSDYEGLYIVDYNPLFRGLNKLPWPLAKWLWLAEFARLKKLIGNAEVIWSFDPFRFQNLRSLGASILIYFSADFHHNKKLVNRIANQADLVLVPSEALKNQIDTKSRLSKINHAVASYFFENAESVSVRETKQRIQVGYVGNLESRYLQRQLLKEVIIHNPEYVFVFASAATGAFAIELNQYPNVILKGLIPNEHVSEFLNCCDVLLLCYDTDHFWIEASNAHKIMEYLSTGIVIVSTKLAEYESKPELIASPRSNRELPEFLSEVVSNLEQYNAQNARNNRIFYARNNTYESQIKLVESLL